ncbi:MAG: SprB repeat-containing protein [Bacteroidetes bacterium]|nr:SprB repeat-containing protein [Bacteroidota bacterium]
MFTYETDNALCGNDNGYFDITVVSGVAPYTYLWSNGATTEDLTGLAAGNYNVTITGANGCSITTAFVINSTTEVITSGNTVNATCDLDNGEINVTVTSGTAPFNFLWNDGATTEDRNGLAGGNYSVTVTDVNGCIASQGFTINRISAPSLSLKGVTDETCGQGNGGIGFNVIGGVAPFTYLWNDGVTVGTRNNLSAGNYTVTLTDGNGCQASLNATVLNINGPTLNFTKVDATCGFSNGSIDLSISGGTPNYSYSWSNGATTEDINGLASGTYNVTVIDDNGCSESLSIVVNNNNAAYSISTSVPANPIGEGDILILNSAGSPAAPSSVSWSGPNAFSSSLEDPIVSYSSRPNMSGIYQVNATYGTCSSSANLNVTVNEKLCDLEVVVLSSLCDDKGTPDPSDDELCLTISVSGLPVGENVDIDVKTNSSGTNKYLLTTLSSNGTHVLPCIPIQSTVAGYENQNGFVLWYMLENSFTCLGDIWVFASPCSDGCIRGISANPVLPTCNLNNGSIDITVIGGTAPFTYLWSNGATTQDITGLASGAYTVTVYDANDCSTSFLFNLIKGVCCEISANSSTINSTCGNNNGSINLSVVGGTAPFTYLWSNGATTEDISSLLAGTYSVLVTDANGCTANNSATITNIAGPTLSNSKIDATCGNNNGSIALTVNLGTSPFTYLWNNGTTTQNLNSLAPANYSVTVTDNNSCQARSSITILDKSGPTLSTTKVDENCGNSNGSINLIVTGGTAPFNYLWSNGATTEDINGLSAGTYTVTVVDANNCSVSTSVTIINLLGPSLSSTTVDASCGNNNGSIDLSVSGGTPGYSYSWSNGATTQDINGLAAGSYTVSVTDAIGCVSTQTITIASSAQLELDYSSTNVLCFGGVNGSIDLIVISGTPGYTYLWSNGSTTEDISNLTAGNYTVNVTDSKGCTASQSISITHISAQISIDPTVVNATCGNSNGSITLSINGGTAPYSYNWGGGITTQNRINLPAGAYAVTVTDANGCTGSANISVSNIGGPTVTFTKVDASCDNNNGSINLNVTGGTTPYTYLWNDGVTTANRVNLIGGTYSVNVTDANGCVGSISVILGTSPALELDYSSNNVLCFGGVNGAIDLIILSGTPNYTYSWSNGATTQDISGLVSGLYTVNVSDSKGCTNAQIVSIINQVKSFLQVQVQQMQLVEIAMEVLQ